MALIDGDGKVYMFGRDYNPFWVSVLSFPHAKSTAEHERCVTDTLLDGVPSDFGEQRF